MSRYCRKIVSRLMAFTRDKMCIRDSCVTGSCHCLEINGKKILVDCGLQPVSYTPLAVYKRQCMGMLEAVGEVFPDAKSKRCTVHFYRNVFSVVPKSKVKIVAKMLKAIHAQESKKASREKAKTVVAELRAMKLKEAAKQVEDGIEETLTYCDFPSEHGTRIRTNNVIERLNREIRRRTCLLYTSRCV